MRTDIEINRKIHLNSRRPPNVSGHPSNVILLQYKHYQCRHTVETRTVMKINKHPFSQIIMTLLIKIFDSEINTEEHCQNCFTKIARLLWLILYLSSISVIEIGSDKIYRILPNTCASPNRCAPQKIWITYLKSVAQRST